MDPILLIAIAVLVVLILIALRWGSRTNSDNNSPTREPDLIPDDIFDFDPDIESVGRLASRKTRFVAPAQKIGGKSQRIRVDLKPLPALDKLQPPPEKGIQELVVLATNPVVSVANTGEEIYEFDPPLTLTIHYRREDVGQSLTQDRVPALSIVSGYESNEGWRFERLATTVTPNEKTGGGTLTAKLATLHPKDPQWVGRP